MATIQDVARLADVSVSSVSNVLNGRTERMRQETYVRIEQAIEKLGYRPNQIARHLKTGNIPILGLLVPTSSNPSFAHLAVAVEQVAQSKHNYRVLACNTYRDKQLEAKMLDDLIGLGIRAVIVISSLNDERHIEAAIAKGLSVVSYDLGIDPDKPAKHDHVLPDNRLAGRLAAEHLIAHGHRRLAFVKPKGETSSRREKIEGFTAAVHAASGCSAQVIEIEGGSRFGDNELAKLGHEAAQKIAAMSPRPTGIVAVNDMTAIGVMAGLRECGLSIPGDVSVVGMDNIPVSEYVWPPLTTVAMPVQEVAETMVEQAISRIHSPDNPPREFSFPPRLVQRQSVSAPATPA
ncbi:LacI family DNA-binding transcriptional regulator [Bordetella sp. 02P26C-1]|uniref:LacI family DNA-binding transcriptional regulator n=1 Tax=Bordetella sp. 02P26C-1 TaxID=2683195 RepID=UPI0013532143|nr:LacI family DNA-binding transcriptional regulator [Bordetella sp. 02P26C-1]MVW80895.1 LacI family DNA-binding transcriptional regulator [Bordetella sp. 02P26C-1]